MQRFRLPLALLALIPLAGLLYFASQKQEQEQRALPDLATLLPEVDPSAVQRVTIDSPRKGKVTLVRRDDGFWLTEPVQGRADAEAVTALLETLAKLDVTSIAATKADNHKKLWVDDKRGIVVDVRGKSDKELLDLVIGRYLPAPQTTLLRRRDEERVLSVTGWLREKIERDVIDWRHRIFFGVEPEQVSAVRFACPETALAFARGPDGWSVAKGEAAIADLDPVQLENRVTSLARFRASNFASSEVEAAQAGTDENAERVIRFEVGAAADGGTARQFELRFGEHAGVEKRDNGTDKQMFYVQHDDDPVVYTTSEYLRGWLCPTAADLKRSEPKGGG